MTSRRQFLRGLGAAVVATRALVSGARWAKLSGPEWPNKVIVDERFPESAEAARHLSGRGIQVHHIRGDVTALWFHDLYFHWRSNCTPVAGVTTAESLFCLEVLARDAGWRVTRRQLLDSGLIAWSIGPGPGNFV
jgi:hypothetical protein